MPPCHVIEIEINIGIPGDAAVPCHVIAKVIGIPEDAAVPCHVIYHLFLTCGCNSIYI
jgi:hypothetical protein